MSNQVEKDRLATHAITNYLFAGYQGRFTFYNILTQLSFPGVGTELIPETKNALNIIAGWTERLWKGDPLFSATWTEAKTFESQKALQFLGTLKPDLSALAAEVERILKTTTVGENRDELIYLVACIGRHSYARENYIRGFLDFGQHFSNPTQEAHYAKLLGPAEEELKVFSSILELIKKEDAAKDPRFVQGIIERATPIVIGFRTHVHDVGQLIAQYQGGLTYEKCGFTAEEITGWKQIGIGPVAAGYWKANEFSPEEAGTWLRLNLSSPQVAHAWRLFGFEAARAQPWIQQGIPVGLARLWLTAGYDPENARKYIAEGTLDPAQITKKA